MPDHATILVVDDEAQIRRALTTNLRARGYEIYQAASGEDALRMAAQHHPDLVILDLGLPGIDGIDVIHGLRGWTTTPIVVLSVRSDESDKVEALDAGADDYVTKPFGMDELLARTRAALRRRTPAGGEESRLATDDFVIDFVTKRAMRPDGDQIPLTPTEWSLVELLARHPGRLHTHKFILHEVWGPGYDTETNYLRVHFANIRRKLESNASSPRYFITEPGLGYRLEL